MGTTERRKREKKQRKAQILDTARELLLRDGHHQVSMNRIARKAELSVGTLYLYFASREELFATLQEEGLDLLYAVIKEASEKKGDPGKRLYNIATAYKKFSDENKNYFDIINSFLASQEIVFSAEMKARVDMHGDNILSCVDEVIRDLGAEVNVEVDREKVRQCSLTFWGNLHGVLIMRKLQDTILKNITLEQQLRHSCNCCIAGLKTYLLEMKSS